ncbi:MAG: hypothetical protein ACYDCP_09935 [Thermoplasmataceae archaeon]
MIDEPTRRKPDVFDQANSVPVVLADGQTWHLPKPWYVIRPTFDGGVATAAYRFFSYSPKLDELVELIGATDDLDAVIVGVATLAAHILLYQYDLADAELDQLLAYRVGDPSSMDWTRAVMETATGRNGKKVGRAGGD